MAGEVPDIARLQRDLLVAEARIGAALKLHRRATEHSMIRGQPDPEYCKSCGRWGPQWPCPTAKALGVEV